MTEQTTTPAPAIDDERRALIIELVDIQQHMDDYKRRAEEIEAQLAELGSIEKPFDAEVPGTQLRLIVASSGSTFQKADFARAFPPANFPHFYKLEPDLNKVKDKMAPAALSAYYKPNKLSVKVK